MTVKYPTLQDVHEIHEIMIQQYGGSSGLRDLSLLESALAAPHQTMFGEELYPDLASKASILLLGLARNHAFVDGNKRIAFMTTLRFLEMNGYTLTATQDELFRFVLDVVTSNLDKDAATTWIRDHMTPLQA